MADLITCPRCDQRWTAPGAAHCSGCHRTFSSVGLFDSHRSQFGDRGACIPPVTLRNTKTGERLAFFRDGMWRGPEMTDEAKAARFGAAS